jgi:hypothetical protein
MNRTLLPINYPSAEVSSVAVFPSRKKWKEVKQGNLWLGVQGSLFSPIPDVHFTLQEVRNLLRGHHLLTFSAWARRSLPSPTGICCSFLSRQPCLFGQEQVGKKDEIFSLFNARDFFFPFCSRVKVSKPQAEIDRTTVGPPSPPSAAPSPPCSVACL